MKRQLAGIIIFIILFAFAPLTGNSANVNTCTFTVSNNAMTIPPRGNLPVPGEAMPKTGPAYYFDVQSNRLGCPWTAVTNANWITVLTQGGTQSGRVQFNVSPNTTGSDRKGTIQIGGHGGGRSSE